MDFENKEAIHNTRIAPTVEVIKLPINPEAASPKRANTQPPNTPPRIPSNKFITRPKPPPRIILPARNPATPNKSHIILLFYLTTAGVANGSVSQK